MRNVYCNETATTEIYTLSLHDALPISAPVASVGDVPGVPLRLDLLAAAAPADPLPARARADDLAVVISSGGTTGEPKRSVRDFATWTVTVNGPDRPGPPQLAKGQMPYLAQLLVYTTLPAGGPLALQ